MVVIFHQVAGIRAPVWLCAGCQLTAKRWALSCCRLVEQKIHPTKKILSILVTITVQFSLLSLSHRSGYRPESASTPFIRLYSEEKCRLVSLTCAKLQHLWRRLFMSWENLAHKFLEKLYLVPKPTAHFSWSKLVHLSVCLHSFFILSQSFFPLRMWRESSSIICSLNDFLQSNTQSSIQLTRTLMYSLTMSAGGNFWSTYGLMFLCLAASYLQRNSCSF